MKLGWILMTLASAVALVGCDKNDDAVQVPAQVETAFHAMYPNATDVRWSGRSGYMVADFRESGVANSAWFDHSGGWHMTDTDIPYQALPEAVKASFEASEYATWRIEEVEKVTRTRLETLYVIEVEQREAEMELHYSEDGVLLNAVADDGDRYNDDLLPQQLPAEVTSFIQQRYPGARILEAERVRGMLEVDIIDGRTACEVVFDSANAWLHTQTEVRRSELPDAVLQAWQQSEYASYELDDIAYYEAPTGDYYELELERGDREVKLRIAADGTML